MSDLRKDPLTGEWAIIAENRGDRPIEYQQQFHRNGPYVCPFCLGNEKETPPTIEEYCEPSTDGKNGDQSQKPWVVRVVPNKYPALEERLPGEVSIERLNSKRSSEQLAQQAETLMVSTPALGANEIIIESSQHKVSFSELSDCELKHTMHAFSDAIRRCRHDEYTESISLFKNCRFQAGASIEHTHSQVISLPIVTSRLERQMHNCRTYFEQTGELLQQAIIRREMEQKERVFYSDDKLIAWCPYASRTPFQICISRLGLPPQLDELNDEDSLDLAKLIRTTVRALEVAIDNPAYNLIIQLAPLKMENVDYYHWYVELFPRVTRPAGLELGTSCWINPVSPEQAATRMRAEFCKHK